MSSERDSEIEELYAEVYANPDDDSARLVLSDALIEKGDPRGEFIALQFGRSIGRGGTETRERKLLRQHGEQWLGRLSKCTLHPVFERGFLARCNYNPERSGAAIGAREWSTVRSLHLESTRGKVAPLLLSEPIRWWTRTIEGIRDECACEALGSTELRRWRDVSVIVGAGHAERLVDAFEGSTNTPELRRFDVYFVGASTARGSFDASMAQRMLSAPLASQLEALSITEEGSDSALSAVGGVAALFGSARGPARVVLNAEAGGVTIHVRGEHAGSVEIGLIRSPSSLATALDALDGCPIRSVRLVKASDDQDYGRRMSEMLVLRAAAERLGSVTMESLP